MGDIKFEIKKNIAVLSTSKSGWTKEINLMSWNGREDKYDIREWDPEHEKCGKGIGLTKEEAVSLVKSLNKELPEDILNL